MDASLSPDDVAYAGVRGQRALLRDGRLTAVELLGLCLARIDALDGRLNAFRTLFPEQARAEAQAADAALAAGDDRPLLGVPVAVKDNVPVAGHASAMGTGSVQPPAAHDAEQVRRLRAAGAVVVGTTHLPELALWPFTESATWGVTRNPWDPSRTPGGSSGGSAAAVASGMVAAATASDGGGSIRVPAACCGLVGLKPTRGRVPLSPDLEHWHGLSSAGVLVRDSADAATVLSVLLGEELEVPAPPALRIAWSVAPLSPAPVQPEVVDAVHRTAAVLAGLGHTLVTADPSYAGVQEAFLVRYARGVRDDLVRLSDPSRTELRTRAVAAVGARLGPRALARASRLSQAAADRPFPAGADVLLTPVLGTVPPKAGALTGLAHPARRRAGRPLHPAVERDRPPRDERPRRLDDGGAAARRPARRPARPRRPAARPRGPAAGPGGLDGAPSAGRPVGRLPVGSVRP